MNSLLNIISVASAFIFGVGSMYWILNVTLGKLKFFQSQKDWLGLQYKDFIFILFSSVLLISLFDFYKPY